MIVLAHSGSGILQDFMKSHPDVTTPRGELHELFLGKGRAEPRQAVFMKRLKYLPIVLAQREFPFNSQNWKPRRPFPGWVKWHVDRILFEDRIKARDTTQNRFKAEGVKYTDAEIRNTRLAVKVTSGDTLLTEIFNEMYPDATFIGLVRHGFGVVESHIRRGSDLMTVVQRYNLYVKRLFEYKGKIPNFHLFRYEDIVMNPLGTAHQIYDACGLNPSKITKFRFVPKPVTTKDGEHKFMHEGVSSRETIIWYSPEELHNYFFEDLNINQAQRLSNEQKQTIVDIAGNNMQRLGYEFIDA